MKIIKFLEFIKEGLDTPESLVEMRLKEIKNRLDQVFQYQEVSDEDSEDIFRRPEDLIKVKGDKLTFKDLGIKAEDSEISKYSKMYDTLTIKFSDDENTYTLIIMIDLKEVINGDPDEQKEEGDDTKSSEDIKNCLIKFKKYSLDKLSEMDQLPTKTVKIDDIDEDFLIDLKIELDDKFGDTDGFEIETK